MDVEAWSTGGSRVIALGDGPRGREPLTRQQKSNFDPIFQSNLFGGGSAKIVHILGRAKEIRKTNRTRLSLLLISMLIIHQHMRL